MSKPNDEAMVQRCGCYSDMQAVLSCIRLLQLRLPALKALAVPTPSDVSPDTDTALIVQLSGVFPVAAGGDCLLKLLLPPTFPKQPPLFKLLPLKSGSEQFQQWRALQGVGTGSGGAPADVCAALMTMRDAPASTSSSSSSSSFAAASVSAFHRPPSSVSPAPDLLNARFSPVADDDNSVCSSSSIITGHGAAPDIMSPQSFEQGQRHIKLLATEVTRMRAEIQVLEGKLALKNSAEGGNVDINMQQLQAQRRAAIDAHQATVASLRLEVRSLRRTLSDKSKSAASAPDGAADGSGGGEATELKMHLVQEDELVSRLRELSRIVAAASVKRLSQANGEPALDVRHVIALSNEELERVIAEARRLQPQTGVQREAVRLLVENCRLALTANDYAEGILKKTLGKLAAAEQGAGSSAQGARNGQGAKSGSFSRMCSKW